MCVADVSGKGLPASLLMANLQAAVRSQVLANASVADCLRRTNTLLFRSTDPGKFVTAFFCVLEPERHELRYSNGGHNHPLLFRAGREPRAAEVGGLILGVFEGPSPRVGGSAGAWDLLVVYSTGSAKRASRGRGIFGGIIRW
jgi:sigma-B regulation protein RsbU (phosphoserine phosphatase)